MVGLRSSAAGALDEKGLANARKERSDEGLRRDGRRAKKNDMAAEAERSGFGEVRG